jgi:leucyl-tRNA synthetase
MIQAKICSDYLAEKLGILEMLLANTERQSRFVQKREIRGLRRVLREREELLEKLSTINSLLAEKQDWKNNKQLTAVRQAISERQTQLLKQSSLVITQAIAEKTKIAAEINSSRTAKNLQNRYASPWLTVSQGSRLNAKG